MPIFALKSCPKSNKLPNLVTLAFTHLFSKTEHNIPIFLCRVLNILQIVSNVPNCGETARANACVNKTTDQCDQIWQNFPSLWQMFDCSFFIWQIVGQICYNMGLIIIFGCRWPNHLVTLQLIWRWVSFSAF